MKATITKKNRVKRTLAGILAAFTMATAVVPTAAVMLNNGPSVSAAEIEIDAFAEHGCGAEKILFKEVKKKGIEYLDKGLDALFKSCPLAAFLKPYIKDEILGLFGLAGEKEVTTNELSKKLDDLEKNFNKALDNQTKELINAMDTAFTAGTYKNDLKVLEKAAKTAGIIQGGLFSKKYDALTEEEKTVKLAMVAGSWDSWNTSGHFLNQLSIVTTDLLGHNYMDSRDIFHVLYDSTKKNYLFSGDALDALDAYIVKMMTDYLRYTALALSSLSAQEKLLSDDFDASNIHDVSLKKQYEAFANDIVSIEGMKYEIARNVFGSDALTICGIDEVNEPEDCYDTVLDNVNKFKQMNRLIHIPTGKALNKNLQMTYDWKLIEGDISKTEDFGINHQESTNKEDFENRISGKTDNSYHHNTFDREQMEEIAAHIQKVVSEKRKTDSKYTALQYLADLGFNVDNNWLNGKYSIPTGGGYEEANYSHWGTYRSTWDAMIDVIDLTDGAIKKNKWKHTYHNGASTTSYYNNNNIYLFFYDNNTATEWQLNKQQAALEKLFSEKTFDADFYYAKYADVRNVIGYNKSALHQHFLENGIKEGRAGCAAFDVKYYVENNPDLKKAFGTDYEKAFVHFLTQGVHEERKLSPYYDAAYYAEHYADIARRDAYYRYLHFFDFGNAEGRIASAEAKNIDAAPVKQEKENIQQSNTIKNEAVKSNRTLDDIRKDNI